MEACHSVTTHCCHWCLSGQSTNLVVLRTSHSKIPEAHIHLLRKLNSSLRRWRATLQATSVALLPALKLAEGSPAASSALAVVAAQHTAPLYCPAAFCLYGMFSSSACQAMVKHTFKICVASWKGSHTRTRASCSSSQRARTIGTDLSAAAATDGDVP